MRMHITRRRALYAGLALIVAALVIFQLARPKRIEVDSAAVAWRALQVTVDESGRTRTVDRYLVVAPVAGRVRRTPLREGQRIRTGTTLATIEPLPQNPATRDQIKAELDVAQADRIAAAAAVTHAQAQQEQAERELARRRPLLQAGAISNEQFEQYNQTLETTQAAVASAKERERAASAQVSAARSALQAVDYPSTSSIVQVRAPASGAVLRITERSERVISAGEPLFEIGDAATLEVVVDVLSSDAVRIRAGMPARLTGWGGAAVMGIVRSVEPAAFTRVSALGVDEQRVNVIIGFDDECPPGMGDGYRVEASIGVWSTPRALVAPPSAFFRIGERWSVFAIRNGRAQLQHVRIGERSTEAFQILDGLSAGDHVVLFPGDALSDGKRVVVRKTERVRL